MCTLARPPGSASAPESSRDGELAADARLAQSRGLPSAATAPPPVLPAPVPFSQAIEFGDVSLLTLGTDFTVSYTLFNLGNS